jgi:hypothetical protein
VLAPALPGQPLPPPPPPQPQGGGHRAGLHPQFYSAFLYFLQCILWCRVCLAGWCCCAGSCSSGQPPPPPPPPQGGGHRARLHPHFYSVFLCFLQCILWCRVCLAGWCCCAGSCSSGQPPPPPPPPQGGGHRARLHPHFYRVCLAGWCCCAGSCSPWPASSSSSPSTPGWRTRGWTPSSVLQ